MSRVGDSLNYLSACFNAARAAACAAALLLVGCSGGPAGVDPPDWDPEFLTDNILEALDKNADGAVDEEELAASPGLKAGADRIDADKDGKLNREELQARFESYQALSVGVRPTTYLVTYRGRPVANATVELIPEPWLEGTIEPAKGITDDTGYVLPVLDNPELPGIRVGFYRVKVTSPNMKIPEKYSGDQSPLGVNVSTGDPNSGYSDNRFTLTD
jgi:hypothetical protein